MRHLTATSAMRGSICFPVVPAAVQTRGERADGQPRSGRFSQDGVFVDAGMVCPDEFPSGLFLSGHCHPERSQSVRNRFGPFQD